MKLTVRFPRFLVGENTYLNWVVALKSCLRVITVMGRRVLYLAFKEQILYDIFTYCFKHYGLRYSAVSYIKTGA